MKKRFFILVYLSVHWTFLSTAQNITFANEIIGSLSSENFHGRGYVARGEKRAADFIANKFSEIGLKSFEENYFQTFDVSVNTLPGRLSFKANGKELIPGIDYLIAPSSPPTEGFFKTLSLSEKVLLDWKKLIKVLTNKRGYFLTVDESKFEFKTFKVILQQLKRLEYSNQVLLGGIALITTSKLTWHTSQSQSLRPFISISKPSLGVELKTVNIKLESEFISKYATQNVIGFLPGESDSVVVLSAHYDHLGRMGRDTYFPGANDNASGSAMLLDLARHYSDKTPKYSMIFMAFGAEELGLLGSSYFVKNPLFSLNKIKFLLNFDIAGTGDNGIQVVNGSVFQKRFDNLKKLNDQYELLPQVKIRGESCNSDHCPFYSAGVPSFFIYTLGGIQAYHDVFDQSETLPLTKYEGYFKLITLFIQEL